MPVPTDGEPKYRATPVDEYSSFTGEDPDVIDATEDIAGRLIGSLMEERLAIIEQLHQARLLTDEEKRLALYLSTNDDSITEAGRYLGFSKQHAALLFTHVNLLVHHYTQERDGMEDFEEMLTSEGSLSEYLASKTENLVYRYVYKDPQTDRVPKRDISWTMWVKEPKGNGRDFPRFTTMISCLDTMKGMSLGDKLAYLVTAKWNDAATEKASLSDQKITQEIASVFGLEIELVEYMKGYVLQTQKERFDRFRRWVDEVQQLRNTKSDVLGWYGEIENWLYELLTHEEYKFLGWKGFVDKFRKDFPDQTSSDQILLDRFKAFARKLERHSVIQPEARQRDEVTDDAYAVKIIDFFTSPEQQGKKVTLEDLIDYLGIRSDKYARRLLSLAHQKAADQGIEIPARIDQKGPRGYNKDLVVLIRSIHEQIAREEHISVTEVTLSPDQIFKMVKAIPEWNMVTKSQIDHLLRDFGDQMHYSYKRPMGRQKPH